MGARVRKAELSKTDLARLTGENTELGFATCSLKIGLHALAAYSRISCCHYAAEIRSKKARSFQHPNFAAKFISFATSESRVDFLGIGNGGMQSAISANEFGLASKPFSYRLA
jgi:hypothetical protein